MMENMIQERQEEKTATDKTIKRLQEEKQAQAHKIADLEQEVKGVLILEIA